MPTDKELLKAEAIYALSDLYYLATEVLELGKYDDLKRPPSELRPYYTWLGRPRPATIPAWVKWLRMWCAPRFTAKTVGAAVWLLSEIVRRPDIGIIWHGDEKRSAIPMVGLVREWLEKPKLARLYGPFKREPGWGGEDFTTAQRAAPAKDPTMQASGMDIQLAGWHPDIVVWDDLISETHHDSEWIRKVRARRDSTIPAMKPGAIGLWLCTRWDYDDPPREHLAKREKVWDCPGPRGYFGAYVTPGDEKFWPGVTVGEPLFPSVLDEAVLTGYRETLPFQLYASQYLNDPVPAESVIFPQDSLQHWSVSEQASLLEGAIFYTAIDPAGGKEGLRRGDDSAIVTAGVKWAGSSMLVYVVEGRGGQWKPDRVATDVCNICAEWRPRKVLVETNVGKEWLLETLRKRAREGGIWLPIEEINAHGSKEGRILRLQDDYAYKRVWHAPHLRNSKLEEQLIRFVPGGTAHDDYPDALATLVAYAASKRPMAAAGAKGSVLGSRAPIYRRTGV